MSNLYATVTMQDLINRREAVKQWALVCEHNGVEGLLTHDFQETPGYVNECHMGDANIFNGISCLAARLAGDTGANGWAEKRCRDVELAQAEGDIDSGGGRWWRGYVRVNNDNGIAFSRDQGLGTLSYLVAEGLVNTDSAKRAEVKQRAKRWIEWMNGPGDGHMCSKVGGKVPQACKIVGAYGAVMYQIFEKIGAIDDSNKKFKLIKKIKRQNFLFNKVSIPEIKLQLFMKTLIPKGLTGDYEFHLKSIQLLLERVIHQKTTKALNKLAKRLYRWDSKNPVYQVFYEGAQSKNMEVLLNKYCPAEKYKKVDFESEISFYGTSSFFIQNKMARKKHYIAMGHDCIYALNLAIADMQNKLFVNKKVRSKCRLGEKKIGTYDDGKLICKPWITASLSQAKCSRYNGIHWEKSNKKYCLIYREGRYKAKKLKSRVCPLGAKHEGEKLGEPICKVNLKVGGFSLSQCYSYDEYRLDNEANPKHCLVPENGYWKKYKITRKCPAGMKYLHRSTWGWPLCKSPIAKRLKIGNDPIIVDIDPEDGVPEYIVPRACKAPIWTNYTDASGAPAAKGIPYVHKNFCGISTRGKFTAHRIDTCPRAAKWLFEHDGKSVCKKAMNFKIKKKKCERKNKTIVNGYCLMKTKKTKYGKFIWARKIK